MKIKRFVGTALLCLALPLSVSAQQMDSGSVYCFGPQDFGEEIQGVFLMEVPENGRCFLADRVLRPGDVLTKQQVENMTFVPEHTEADAQAELTYLPIGDSLGAQTTFSLGIRGKENKAPEAEDSSLETYKNLANTGRLLASDPEGEPLTFTVTRQPRRGTVEIKEDGSFTYTPKSNKVGVDSFAYTASDPGGKTSREATVTITILRPTEPENYADTQGTDCCFSAQWMCATGIFSGETLAGQRCFQPEKKVTRGEFLTMVVKTLSIPVEDVPQLDSLSDYPQWLRPYAAAALRFGLTDRGIWKTGWQSDQDLTGNEAAALLCGALDLDGEEESWIPMLEEKGIDFSQTPVTRAQAANALYRLHQLTQA